MAKQTKQAKTTITKAEKKDAVKALFRELLQIKTYKRTALIDETAALYTQRFPDKDTENVNDVKGRVGSVFDIMKKEGEIVLDGGMYALKTQKEEVVPIQEPENKPPKQTVKKKAKESTRSVKRTTAKKSDKEKKEEKDEPIAPVVPMLPVNPNYPVDPIAPVVLPIPLEEPKKEKEDKEKATVKKRAKKSKNQEEETFTAVAETAVKPVEEGKQADKKRSKKTKTESKKQLKEKEQALETVQEKAEEQAETKVEETSAQQKEKTLAPVFDMTVLLGEKKNVSLMAESRQEKQEKPTMVAAKQEMLEDKPSKTLAQKEVKQVKSVVKNSGYKTMKLHKAQTADEQLKERFLKRLRSLSGEYFEYYATYLLERYSLKNDRRLESLRICGGERDGGIDGEIELTDRLGFRETIYIQAKNWNPEKGDEKSWVVGETLLQQFIGACVCRQTKEGKQHCRGIFITTSRFTTEAKRLLEEMSEKFVGYDGNDLYEAAKECAFGLIQKNGEWALDEKLLSSEKAFFSLY